MRSTPSELVESEFGVRASQLAKLRPPESAHAYTSDLFIVTDEKGTRYVYKRRRLRPVEEVDVPHVLEKIRDLRISGLCPVVAFTTSSSTLHLLLEAVRGRSLEHTHDRLGLNDPDFARTLRRWPFFERLRAGAAILDTLGQLHQAGLIFNDLKVEQVSLSDSCIPTILDVDTIVQAGSASAQYPVWGSAAHLTERGPATRWRDLRYAARLVHELLFGCHYPSRPTVTTSLEDGAAQAITRLAQACVGGGIESAQALARDLTQLSGGVLRRF